jgi:signal transduction histidine kinase
VLGLWAWRRSALPSWITEPRWVSDAALAAVMTTLSVVGAVGEALAPVNAIGQTIASGGHPVVPGARWEAFLLVGAAGVSLLVRRRWPLPVWAFSLVCVMVFSMLGYENGAALLDPMVAVYTVAVTVSVRRALLVGVVSVIALMGVSSVPFSPFPPFGGSFLLIPGEIGGAAFLGMAIGSRRAYIRATEERAIQAERTREEEARRRVDAERLRIARELHDVVAHTMSMIHVQASAASQQLRDQPDEALAALQAIRSASREGLRELRAILSVLRQADENEPTAPAPGLSQLDELVSATTRAGLPTRVSVQGRPRRLSPTVDLAAYRIVQESLTNALRHAGPAEATVGLGWSEDELVLRVEDNGGGNAGAPANGSGHGISGMRERAMAVGGSLEAGPGEAGGFRVIARLPLQGAAG